tara:strand:- start:127983 stop:128189 length:207 start_codon:yes stop_codon:yes gene_type:complete
MVTSRTTGPCLWGLLLGFGFQPGLLEASSGDDLGDLLRAQIMVEFREHPNVSILLLSIAATTSSVSHG